MIAHAPLHDAPGSPLRHGGQTVSDPRETARAWLAERINTSLGAGGSDLSRAALAGVEVDTEYGVLVDGVFTPRPSAEEARREAAFCNEADPTRVRTPAQRVAIRLPAQPIGETT